MRTIDLYTPPLPLVVPAETFDDFGWCPSDVLPWSTPGPGLLLNPFVDTLPLVTIAGITISLRCFRSVGASPSPTIRTPALGPT